MKNKLYQVLSKKSEGIDGYTIEPANKEKNGKPLK